MTFLTRTGTVTVPVSKIVTVLALVVSAIAISGCSNPVGLDEEDYCPVVETGDVEIGLSNGDNVWYGVGVSDRTQAQVGHEVSVLQDGQGMHRFHIDRIDTVTVAGVAFLIDDNSTASVPRRWVTPTYEVVDCR